MLLSRPIVIARAAGPSTLRRERGLGLHGGIVLALTLGRAFAPPARARDRRRRAALGVETITPYTCSGLMVREYYIRI